LKIFLLVYAQIQKFNILLQSKIKRCRMRRLFIILLIVTAVVAVSASVWVLFFKKDKSFSNSIFDAIPLDAVMIIDIRKYGDLCEKLRENSLWTAMSEMQFIKEFNDKMLLLDSVADAYRASLFFQDNIVFSMHDEDDGNMQSIGYLHLNNTKDFQMMWDIIRTQLVGKAAVSTNNYNGVVITNIAFNNRTNDVYNFSIAYNAGILVFSHSKNLLQQAIRQINGRSSITDNENLSELIRSAGRNAAANIYLNYKKLPQAAQNIIHNKHHEFLESVTMFADWTELDLNVQPDVLILNGFTESTKNVHHWSDIVLSQPAIATAQIVEQMPVTTYAFLWMGIQQADRYFADYHRYLEANEKADKIKELERLKTEFYIDFTSDLIDELDSEIALVYANVGQPTSAKPQPFVIMRIKDNSDAMNMIERWQEGFSRRRNAALETREISVNNETYKLFQLSSDMPMLLFGDAFASENRWCVLNNNYLIFGNSPDNLQRYLNSHTNMRLNAEYSRITNLLPSRSNLMFYGNTAMMDAFFKNVLEDTKYNDIKTNTNAAYNMAFQLGNVNGRLYNNIFVTQSLAVQNITTQSPQRQQRGAWGVLDAPARSRPYLVVNHNTNEMEVFVQDTENNIYLINNAGRILWQKKLPDPIISDVYQIDIFRNQRLQLFFNTKNHLYVFDRNGNTVGSFPVALRTPALRGASLFDYDNNRQYRIMVACQDRVYLYDTNGRTVDGWTFRQSDSPIQTDIYHYRTSGRDYIVFADKQRLYILDRQGRVRTTPEYNFPIGHNTTISLDTSNARIVLADTTGVVHYVSLSNGRITQQKIKTFPSTHSFHFQDVNGDGQADFIYSYDNNIEIFNQNGEQIVIITTDEPIVIPPAIYRLTAGNVIGVIQSNKILLYNVAGQLLNNFPKDGNTPASIGRMDRAANSNFSVIVGNGNLVHNYIIE
jgi:hypothetical protein